MGKVIGIDLFCGIGGLTNGLNKAGIKIKAGFDIDSSCQKSYEQKSNGKPNFVNKDISKLTKEEIETYFNEVEFGDYKLVAGCAPCQPYSSHQRKKTTEARSKHKSYGLIKEYIRVVDIVKPDFVVMENVRQLKNDPFFLNDFLNYFNKNNYFIDYKIVDMADYGAPQRRKRLLFLATKKEVSNYLDFKILPKTDDVRKTVFQAIGHLPRIESGNTNSKDPLHISSKLSDLNLERIKASKESGTWRDWPTNLLLNCYKKESGKTYTSVYGRMDRNKVAPTLTTQFTRYGTGRYGHYEQNRAISLREGAILQTFPNDYEFNLKLGTTIISRQIGNAVPPIFAEKIGNLILKNIKK